MMLCGVQIAKDADERKPSIIGSILWTLCILNKREVYINGHEYTSMATNIHQWPRIYINGHQYTSMATNIHQWPRIYINGHEYTSMATKIHQWPRIYINGHEYTSTATNIHQWPRIYINGHENTSTATNIHQRPRIYINGHQYTSMATNIHQWPRKYINGHEYTTSMATNILQITTGLFRPLLWFLVHSSTVALGTIITAIFGLGISNIFVTCQTTVVKHQVSVLSVALSWMPYLIPLVNVNLISSHKNRGSDSFHTIVQV